MGVQVPLHEAKATEKSGWSGKFLWRTASKARTCFHFLSTYQWAAQDLGRKGPEAGSGPVIAKATKIGMSSSVTDTLLSPIFP